MKKEVVKLGDICNIKSSKRIYKTEYTDAGIPFYRGKEISELSRGNSPQIELFISRERYDELKEKFGAPQKGDLLITSVGTIGNTWVSDGREFYYKDGNITQITNNENIDTAYISHLFATDIVKKQYQCNGTAQAALTIEKLNKITVPMPPLKIQEKIVIVLDKAQELIDKRNEQIQACDELIKSRFVGMFGDPVYNSKELPLMPLGEMCNMKAGKGIKACDIFDSLEEEMYPCYGGNGLRGYVKWYTHEGSIPLIGRQGALCGNIQYAKGKFYATEHAIAVQPKIEINICWLYIMLREMNLNRLASGAAQPGLNVSTLTPLEVIYPPIELQNQFATFVQQVDKLKFEMEKSLEELENNYQSLIQRAFKGELFN